MNELKEFDNYVKLFDYKNCVKWINKYSIDSDDLMEFMERVFGIKFDNDIAIIFLYMNCYIFRDWLIKLGNKETQDLLCLYVIKNDVVKQNKQAEFIEFMKGEMKNEK